MLYHFLLAVSSFFGARHVYLRENTKEHSRLIKYWSNFDVLPKNYIFCHIFLDFTLFREFSLNFVINIQNWGIFTK